MKKLALLLLLLALGALGLVACGGGDDDEATSASETATIGAALEAGPTRKDCGEFRPFPGDDYPAIKVAVVGGDNSCFAARGVMRDFYAHGNRWIEETAGVRTRGSWTCHGPEGLVKCKKSGAPSGGTIRGHFDQGTFPPDPAEATAAYTTETTDDGNPYDYDALAADPADNKSCGTVGGRGLTVVEGDISCREARRLTRRAWNNRPLHQWRCIGPEGATGGYEVCTHLPGSSSRIVIKVDFAVDPESRRNEERIEQKGNKWAAAFAAGRAACRYVGQPACERAHCQRGVGNMDPIRNCTPPSVEFRRSFDGATVERVVVSEDRRHARAEFSNGESVEFEGQRADEGDNGEGWGNWAFFITERWIKNASRS